MKKHLTMTFAVLFCTVGFAQKTKKFDGTFFSIKYPANFKIKNKCPNQNDCNSLTVVSPDKTVEFYVYSPQWNGDPELGVTDSETEVTRKESKNEYGETVIEVTIAANNKSYTRSYIDFENTDFNTRRSFGIKYKNMAAYKKYKAQYLAFKKSLVQFAD